MPRVTCRQCGTADAEIKIFFTESLEMSKVISLSVCLYLFSLSLCLCLSVSVSVFVCLSVCLSVSLWMCCMSEYMKQLTVLLLLYNIKQKRASYVLCNENKRSFYCFVRFDPVASQIQCYFAYWQEFLLSGLFDFILFIFLWQSSSDVTQRMFSTANPTVYLIEWLVDRFYRIQYEINTLCL